MKIILTLDKPDIVTTKVGLHYQIDTGTILINLTPEAVKELLSDLTQLSTGE